MRFRSLFVFWNTFRARLFNRNLWPIFERFKKCVRKCERGGENHAIFASFGHKKTAPFGAAVGGVYAV